MKISSKDFINIIQYFLELSELETLLIHDLVVKSMIESNNLLI